ncbi:hypothetical protein A4A49_04466 [Nicotiana attenuata]|uniref:DUF4283 domain-containing protein n=1 Tax=Nicotiana attenuata TaxID=49451 RepID=A0A314LH96_NICAT|nr:hypothetical protein A4A49_04466 [Nicotiana attenuata]
MGSAPTVMQAPPEVEKEELKPLETATTTAARKLTYSAGSQAKRTMVEVVKGNRVQTKGMQLNFYPPIVKNGVKMAKLNPKEIEQQSQRWKTALIGYVLGGNPSFKEMLKFVYGVWSTVTTPTVLLHDDGYFIFKFESVEDKNLIMQNGPYTFNSRPMVLKDWEPNFQMQNESMRIVPIWINLPGLPIQCWAEENLGRIASLLGKPICTDRLTAECERVSYARILVEMDTTQPMPDDFCVETPNRSWMQRVEFEWKPKFCIDCNEFGHAAEESNNTNTQQKEIQTEPVVEIQVNNRGKLAVITQGAAGKPKQAEINYEEIARRNAFAPLRILERPSIEGQQGQSSSTIVGQMAKEGNPSFHKPP